MVLKVKYQFITQLMHFWGPRQCYVRRLFLFLMTVLDFLSIISTKTEIRHLQEEGKRFVSDV